MSADRRLGGRLVLGDRVAPGRVTVADGLIRAIELDESEAGGPLVAPGYVDVHVHGWGGHDATGSPSDLDELARALLRHGVTSFLPTAVSAPLEALARFASTVRAWLPGAPLDGAEPLGFNLEGPFLAHSRRGAHDPRHLRSPHNTPSRDLEPLLDGLRLITIAPELPGALGLIRGLAGRGVTVSLGHSEATFDEARAGYDAGARSTTHLFNAMTGADHRKPGLAAAALADDRAWVELIADGQHVDPARWPLIVRSKPADRLIIVSDAVPPAGTGDGRGTLGGLEVEIRGDRCTLVDGGALAGSVVALDAAVRNLVGSGQPIPRAVAAASANPAGLLELRDRGRIAEGLRADLIELDDDLQILGVMRGGTWIDVTV